MADRPAILHDTAARLYRIRTARGVSSGYAVNFAEMGVPRHVLERSWTAGIIKLSLFGQSSFDGRNLNMDINVQSPTDGAQLIAALKAIVGRRYVLTNPASTRRFRTGYRSGTGAALAVARPGTLVEMWRALCACAAAGRIVIVQAANTGLTGGSTPDGDDYDREIVIINTLRLSKIHLLDGGRQVLCLPGATLFQLEEALKPLELQLCDVKRINCHAVRQSTNNGSRLFGET